MKQCEGSFIALLYTWFAALVMAGQPKGVKQLHIGSEHRSAAPVSVMQVRNGSRMPTVKHTKTAGNGYLRGSPLYGRQESLKEAGMGLTEFEGVYPGSGGKFKGYLPSANGTAPLFMWLPSTDDDYWAPIYQFFTYQMALRGFAAASIGYNNWEMDTQLCHLRSKADNVFKKPNGALATLCARADIDCSKGVAVAGHGQGAILAMFSAQSDVQVTAQLVLSGSSGDGGSNVTCAITAPDHCLWSANLTDGGLDRTKRRYLIGVDDSLMGGSPAFVPESMKRVSGYDCGTDLDCIQPDGSGYFIIAGSDLTQAKCDKVQHAIAWTAQPVQAESELICDWLSEKKFGLQANLDWLAATALTSGSPLHADLTFKGSLIPCANACPAMEKDMCEAVSQRFWTTIICVAAIVILSGLLIAFVIYFCCVQKV